MFFARVYRISFLLFLHEEGGRSLVEVFSFLELSQLPRSAQQKKDAAVREEWSLPPEGFEDPPRSDLKRRRRRGVPNTKRVRVKKCMRASRENGKKRRSFSPTEVKKARKKERV